jgi:outer membrane autotransporter protein
VQISLYGSDVTWTGAAGNGNWTDSANWTLPFVAGTVVYFAGSNQTDVDTVTDQTVGGIVFDAGADPFTISNNIITLTGNVINQSSANQTIYSGITLATNANLIAESGNLVFGGISFGANATSLTVNGSNDTLINNTISGTGSLLKSGAGTLTLSGHNTFKGNITISDGNLAILGGSAVPDGVAVTLSSANATLTIGTSETIDSLQGVGTTAINANQILTINQVGNTSYSGSITGLGELKIAGAGTLTLSGSSTYGGGTTLLTGTLVLAGANCAGTGDIYQKLGETNLLQIDTTGTITNTMVAPNLLATQNATLSGAMWSFGTSIWNVQTGVTLTASGSLAGIPTLTKTGNGTLVLNGNTPPSNGINVISGTLASGNLTGTTLILQNGGAYSPGATNTIDTVSVGGITLNGGDLLYNLGNATSDRINASGTAELNGPVVFDFSNLGYSAGNFTLLTGNGISTFNTANLSYNAVGNFSVTGNFVVSGNSLIFQTVAPAANYTWDGGAGNGNWNAAANWSSNQVPPNWQTVHFAGNNQLNVDTVTNQSVSGIVFDENAGSFTISNNTINLAGNIEIDSSNEQNINANINLVSNSAIAANAARLVIGGLITFGENSKFLAISGANSTDITGNITGNGSLLKRGIGTLTLSGANTYDGETLINAGNLVLEGGAALNDSGIVKLAASGATFTVEDSETIGSLQGGGTTAIHAGQTLTIAETGNATYSGAITGSGALKKTGSGTLMVSGSNSYTGETTLSGGTLQLLHANALGNGSLYLSSGILAVGDASSSGGNGGLGGAGGNGGLFVPGHITWASSNAIVSLASTGNITTAGHFTDGGNVGNRTFDFGSGQYLQLGNNTLVNFGATTFNATHFQATYSPGTSLSGTFQIVGNSLVYVLQGGSASGSVINNSGAGGTQTWMDFTVNGSATTATGNNTIRSLTFTNNGNLAIQAGYALTLSQGQVAVAHGSSVVSGGTLATPGNFNKTGAGELDVQSTLLVNGTASIDAGLLSVNGNLIANSVAVGSGNGGDAALQVNGQLTANTVVVGNPGHSAGGGFATNTLTVNGQLAANSLVVNQGGALGGSGTIFAPVTVSGTLAPGNSPGTLSMAALTLTPTAVTDIEIESLTNFDRLVVGGAATVDGTLNVIPYNGNPLAYGQQYSFLTAGGGISGEFDTITAPATFRGRFLKLGTITALQAIYVPADDLTGILLIAPDTYTRVAVTPNQREVAKALDSFIPATSGDQQTVSIALDLQTAEQYPTAFEQIMPGFYESLANISIEQTYNQAQLLTQRMGMVRLGATGFQAIGLSQPIKYDKDGTSAADAKTASPIVESAMATNWNSWVMANGEFSLSRGLSGVPNYKNNAGGFLVGADYRLSENFAAGLFAGYEYSYAKYDGGSSTAGNSALFGLYGSYTNENGYYADAVVSGGYTGFQTRRSIEFSTIARTARANPNSGQFSAALNLGKDFEIGKFTLGPIIGAQYTYAGIGGFTETGADSLDLALGQQNANSLRSNLGARLAYNWEVGSNITLIPEIRAFWMHEFLNNSRNISSALDGGNGASFDYETEAPYRNSIFGGVGVSAKVGDRWNASVFYNVNFGSENYTNNIISTSLNFAF